jgi:hypothetical protein
MTPDRVYMVDFGSTDRPDVRSDAGTAPTYTTAGTTSAATGTSAGPASGSSSTEDSDPELAWLSGPEALRYAGHWVALRAGTSEFLGVADEAGDVQYWQERGASVLYVAPPGLRISG